MGLPTGPLHSPTPRHRDAAKRAQTAGTARNSLGKPAENRRPRPNAAPTTPPDVPAQCPNLRLRSYSVATPARTTWPAPQRRKPRRAAMTGVQTQLHRPSTFRRPPADSPIALTTSQRTVATAIGTDHPLQTPSRRIHGNTRQTTRPCWATFLATPNRPSTAAVTRQPATHGRKCKRRNDTPDSAFSGCYTSGVACVTRYVRLRLG